MKRDWENTGLRINAEYLSHLRFADDIVLLSESAEHLQKMLEQLPESMVVGLKIINKSKVRMNKHASSALFSLLNETLEQVEDYSYLVQMVSADPNHEKDIRRIIGLGWGALGNPSQIIKSEIPLSLKSRIYNLCVLPVMAY